MNWETPLKPAELAESRLIEAILTGHFAIGASLPAERELAAQLGVTRPTLREALQRVARDGWVEIRHGRSTRVCNYWVEGGLGVLDALARQPSHTPPDFVPDLLAARQALAPAYTRLAVSRDAHAVVEILQEYDDLPDTAVAFSQADWNLHHRLTVTSGNPIFTLILNGFKTLYQMMGPRYFAQMETRAHSRAFYAALLQAAQAQDPDRAEQIVARVMSESLALWRQVHHDE
jgi:GntR family transcriptional regulator, negative regulator for fad regulon and positive regulator of fabA